MASARRAACHDRLLAIFLEIDKEPETQAEERALRGVGYEKVEIDARGYRMGSLNE